MSAGESRNPLTAKTEDQRPRAAAREQECALRSFTQSSLINEQQHEHFNTKISDRSATGVTSQHQTLLERASAEIGTAKFEDLSDADQEDVGAPQQWFFSCQAKLVTMSIMINAAKARF